jgi:hypothetical protein
MKTVKDRSFLDSQILSLQDRSMCRDFPAQDDVCLAKIFVRSRHIFLYRILFTFPANSSSDVGFEVPAKSRILVGIQHRHQHGAPSVHRTPSNHGHLAY